jgi:hypothetical protein
MLVHTGLYRIHGRRYLWAYKKLWNEQMAIADLDSKIHFAMLAWLIFKTNYFDCPNRDEA